MRAALFTATALFAVLPALPLDSETETAEPGGGVTTTATVAVYTDVDLDRHRPDKLHRRRGLARAFADGTHGRRPPGAGPRGLRFIRTR